MLGFFTDNHWSELTRDPVGNLKPGLGERGPGVVLARLIADGEGGGGMLRRRFEACGMAEVVGVGFYVNHH